MREASGAPARQRGRSLARILHLRRPWAVVPEPDDEEIGPDLQATSAADGAPLGIETVSPSVVSGAEVLVACCHLDTDRPYPADLTLLREA